MATKFLDENAAFQDATSEEVGAVLADILANGNDVERCLAAQGLSRLGAHRHGPDLIAALRDTDEDVRIDAATAIAAIGLQAAGPILVDNLIEDPSPDAKLAYVKALGVLALPEAGDMLRKLVRSPCDDEIAWDEAEMLQSGSDDWLEIQLAAIDALSRIGDARSVHDIKAALADEFGQDLLRPALTALLAMGAKGAEVAVSYLASESDRARRVAVSVLASHAGQALNEFADRLIADPDPDVRLAIVNALPERDQRLLDLLRDPHEHVRAAIASRIVTVLPKRFDTLSNDPSEIVRLRVLNAYLALPGLQATSNLFEKLVDWAGTADPHLAAAAITALSSLFDNRAIGPIRQAALKRGAHGEVRRAAIQAIGRLRPEFAFDVLTQVANDPLRSIRLEAVGAVAEIAKDGSENEREAAAAFLACAIAGELIAPNTEDKEAAAAKANGEVDPDGSARHGAHAAAEDNSGRGNRVRIDEEGNIIPAEARQAARESAVDQIPMADEVPEMAVTSTLDALQDGLSAPMPHGSQDDLELSAENLEFLALTRTGGPGKRKLTPDKGAPAHIDVRVLAARTASKIPQRRIVNQLIEVLSDTNDDLRRAAAMSLARLLETPSLLDEAAVGRLAPALADHDPIIRTWLVRAAANETEGLFVEAVRERLSDDVAIVRAEAVGFLARRDAAFEPENYLQDPDASVRCRAADAVLDRHGAKALPTLLERTFDHDGADRFEAAKRLRNCNRQAANADLIDAIGKPRVALERRVALDVLVEVNANAKAHAST